MRGKGEGEEREERKETFDVEGFEVAQLEAAPVLEAPYAEALSHVVHEGALSIDRQPEVLQRRAAMSTPS